MIKQISIDWDNTSDLKKHIQRLLGRRKELMRKNPNYDTINFGIGRFTLNDMMDIFEFLVGLKYPNLSESVGNYYVYVHCNPLRKIDLARDIREILLASKYNLSYLPFYVGKGIGSRCYDLNRNEGHRKIRTNILKKEKEVLVVKIKENLCEDEALFEEQKLISFLGLVTLNKQGYLINLQTDSEIVNFYQTEFQNKFIPKAERQIQRGKNLLKVMKGWM